MADAGLLIRPEKITDAILAGIWGVNQNGKCNAEFGHHVVPDRIPAFDQPHPLCGLCKRAMLPHLTKFLESGGRKIAC